jgi:hypothetical protein
MGKWKATDLRWQMIAEGRWPPHNPGQRRLSGKSTRRPGLGPGRFQPRQDQLWDRRRSHRYAEHGLTTLRKAVRTLGARAIDPTTPVGRALSAWQRDLVQDLGGAETVTTAQRQVIEVAARTKLLLDSIDGWLFRQPRLVHYKTRSCYPVVARARALEARRILIARYPLHRLRLGEVEAHFHLSVHRSRGPQMLLGLRAVPSSSIELAEAEVAVGDEGAHAEAGRPRQCLLVGSLGLPDARRVGPRSDLTEKTPRPRHGPPRVDRAYLRLSEDQGSPTRPEFVCGTPPRSFGSWVG